MLLSPSPSTPAELVAKAIAERADSAFGKLRPAVRGQGCATGARLGGRVVSSFVAAVTASSMTTPICQIELRQAEDAHTEIRPIPMVFCSVLTGSRRWVRGRRWMGAGVVLADGSSVGHERGEMKRKTMGQFGPKFMRNRMKG